MIWWTLKIRKGTAMQKWEYMEIYVGYLEQKKSRKEGQYVVSINGQAQDPNNSPSFYPYITQLGEQGWELVNAYSHFGGGSNTWVFKRPKP
jgi:hypothetical protein